MLIKGGKVWDMWEPYYLCNFFYELRVVLNKSIQKKKCTLGKKTHKACLFKELLLLNLGEAGAVSPHDLQQA